MRWALLLLLVGCPAVEPPDTPAPGPLVADAGEDVAVLVGEPLTLDGSGSTGGVTWAWDFGDGDAAAPSSSPTATHTWTEPGHHVAVLSVTDPEGRSRTDAVVVTAHLPAHDGAITNPSALGEHAGRFFVPLPDFDLIAVVDGGAVSHLATCGEPRSVAVTSSTLVVACAADAVDVFDLSAEPPTRRTLPAHHPFSHNILN